VRKERAYALEVRGLGIKTEIIAVKGCRRKYLTNGFTVN
jgi:hypothetical protein